MINSSPSQVRLQIDATRLDIVDVVIPKSKSEPSASEKTPSPKSQVDNTSPPLPHPGVKLVVPASAAPSQSPPVPSNVPSNFVLSSSFSKLAGEMAFPATVINWQTEHVRQWALWAKRVFSR